MMKTKMTALIGAVGMAALGVALGGAAAPPDGPSYTADGKLNFPEDYRDWLYLSSGMDMSYAERPEPTKHAFDNVFVDRKSAEAFRQTGHWPDKTMFVLEIRNGDTNASINKAGVFQVARRGLEMHVRDDKRFAETGGWGFFGFDGSKPQPASQIQKTANCYACHQDHGAVDTTFTQFYPTMLPIAEAKRTATKQ